MLPLKIRWMVAFDRHLLSNHLECPLADYRYSVKFEIIQKYIIDI